MSKPKKMYIICKILEEMNKDGAEANTSGMTQQRSVGYVGTFENEPFNTTTENGRNVVYDKKGKNRHKKKIKYMK